MHRTTPARTFALPKGPIEVRIRNMEQRSARFLCAYLDSRFHACMAASKRRIPPSTTQSGTA